MTTKSKKNNTNKKVSSEDQKNITTELPWSLRGVTRETRSYIEKAAKREQKKIGEWVNEKLLLAAQEALSSKPSLPVKQEDLIDKFSIMEKNQAEQSEKINQLLYSIRQLAEREQKSLFARIFYRKKEDA